MTDIVYLQSDSIGHFGDEEACIKKEVERSRARVIYDKNEYGFWLPRKLFIYTRRNDRGY